MRGFKKSLSLGSSPRGEVTGNILGASGLGGAEILSSRGGDWKPRPCRTGSPGGWILPSRGGDWKHLALIHRIDQIRSSPRGEVTGNHALIGTIVQASVILPSRGGDWKHLGKARPVQLLMILPSRGGDWKPCPGRPPSWWPWDPPLAGR